MDSALVGRAGPLRAVAAALDAAVAGRGQLVLVSGEAGIGKSTVAAAIAREAETRGAVVTWGRAWEFADAPPYFPVWPCLRTLGIDPVEAATGQPFQLWERVVGALARQPLSVWILEDLHAADLGTLDLLTFLALPLRAMRVLVIATVRTGEARVTDRMQQRLARMARDGTELALEPLSDAGIAEVVATLLGRAPPEAAVARLRALTGGNPLFVVECARAFRTAGGIEGTLGALPPTVRQVVLERVALLPAATRDALAGGAVLGREFSAATLARMTDALPARTIDALLPALRVGLVHELRPGAFAFVHGLVRDAIEDAIGDEPRAQLHDRACSALGAVEETADVLVERARHALAAARSGDPARAVAIAARAVELLEREGAADRAFELLARVDAARTAGFLPPTPPDEMLQLARLARAAGRSEAGRAPCERAIAHARTTSDPVLLARAALQLALDVRPGVVDARQVALLAEARAALGDRDPALAARVIARLATAMLPAADLTEPHALAHEALARARALGDEATLLEVLSVGGWANYASPPAEQLAWANELLERAVAAGDLVRALHALDWLAFAHVETGDRIAFEHDVSTMLAMSDELGHPRHRWRPLLHASGAAVARGQFAESERHLTELAQLAPLIDDPALEVAFATHEMFRARVQRRDAEVPAALDRHGATLRDIRNRDAMLGVHRAICAARYEDDATVRALFPTVRSTLAMLVYPLSRALAAEAVAVAGTDDERRAMRDELAPRAAVDITGGAMSFTYEGTFGRMIGLLEASLGELAAAERELRRALELERARGHAPWVAQLSYELGKVLDRAGKRDEARALFADAHRIARELGMTGLAGVLATTTERDDGAFAIVAEGEVWRVERGATCVRVKDSRGMQLLARLVEQRDQEVHVLALASDEGASAPDSDAGEVLDDAARRAYRARLTELDDELADAERRGSVPRATKLAREREALLGELARATGIGGRARKSGSATERARINVQRRLKDAIARVAEADAELGAFLEHAVRTGTFCCFKP